MWIQSYNCFKYVDRAILTSRKNTINPHHLNALSHKYLFNKTIGNDENQYMMLYYTLIKGQNGPACIHHTRAADVHYARGVKPAEMTPWSVVHPNNQLIDHNTVSHCLVMTQDCMGRICWLVVMKWLHCFHLFQFPAMSMAAGTFPNPLLNKQWTQWSLSRFTE